MILDGVDYGDFVTLRITLIAGPTYRLSLIYPPVPGESPRERFAWHTRLAPDPDLWTIVPSIDLVFIYDVDLEVSALTLGLRSTIAGRFGFEELPLP